MTLKNSISFEDLQEIKYLLNLLNKVVPIKCKYLRANYPKFMTNELIKAIMLRTRFRHQFLKMKTSEAKAKYNKQRNICVSLTGKAKRNYYESLNLNNVCDNNKFWATVKFLFSNKIKLAENIIVSENGKLTKTKKLLIYLMMFL